MIKLVKDSGNRGCVRAAAWGVGRGLFATTIHDAGGKRGLFYCICFGFASYLPLLRPCMVGFET